MNYRKLSLEVLEGEIPKLESQIKNAKDYQERKMAEDDLKEVKKLKREYSLFFLSF